MENSSDTLPVSTEKNEKRRLWPWLAGAGVLIAVVAAVILFVLVPDAKYNAAVEQFQNKQYDAAAEMFDRLVGYRNSSEMAKESRYQIVVGLLVNRYFDEATELLKNLGNYKDSEAILASIADYRKATYLLDYGYADVAAEIFTSLGDFGNSATMLKKSQYQIAADLISKGSYRKASAILGELGDYQDSAALLDGFERKYQNAKDLLSKGSARDAALLLNELGDYKESISLLEANKWDILAQAQAGDVVKLGSYEQDNEPANGQESIDWKVLAREDGKLLLLAVYRLDVKPYHSKTEPITWENCSLRKWLNKEFVNTAFSTKERSAIVTTMLVNADNPEKGTDGGRNTKDTVFLLSIDEYNKYHQYIDDVPPCTRYAECHGASTTYGGRVWHLRSPSLDPSWAAAIAEGYLEGGDVTIENAVRPAIWVSLENDQTDPVATPGDAALQPAESDNELVSIVSNGETALPYLRFSWGNSWSGDGWVAADALQLVYELPGIAPKLPVVRYDDDFELRYADGASASSLSIYDSNFQQLDHIASYDKVIYTSRLDQLPEGTYYVAISVAKQGKFIKSENEYEFSGYDCVFQLVVKR